MAVHGTECSPTLGDPVYFGSDLVCYDLDFVFGEEEDVWIFYAAVEAVLDVENGGGGLWDARGREEDEYYTIRPT